MVTHSSILAWEIPWTEEPAWLQPVGLQSVGHDLSTCIDICVCVYVCMYILHLFHPFIHQWIWGLFYKVSTFLL